LLRSSIEQWRGEQMSAQSPVRLLGCVLAIFALACIALPGAASASGAAPSIEGEWLTDITASDATLNAEIDPHGSATGYQFHLYRYVSCPPPSPGKATCTVIAGWVGSPLPEGHIEAGGSPVVVSLKLSDAEQELHPETEYRYTVDATNEAGSAEAQVRSFTTPGVSEPPVNPPSNSIPPELSGTPEVGATLECTSGSWQNEPSEYSYSWLRDSSVIPAETHDTYEVQAGDGGADVTCEVQAANKAGPKKALSNALAVPPPPPVNVAPPVLSGSAEVGGTLSCSDGQWEHQPLGFGYSWLRDGTPFETGGDAIASVTATDRGHSLSCEVTASNEGGSVSIASNSLGVPAVLQPLNRASTDPVVVPPLASALPPRRARCNHRPGGGRQAHRKSRRGAKAVRHHGRRCAHRK
jgi:hypothetical protein